MPKQRYRVDLPAEMAQCALNYARLQRLMPGCEEGGATVRGRADWQSRRLGVGDDIRIAIEVAERGPYTTTLQISQQGGVAALPPPRLTVRVYHDARLAEVVAFCDKRRVWPRYSYPNAGMYQPDEKAQWNRFLGDWLSLCLHHGWTPEALPAN